MAQPPPPRPLESRWPRPVAVIASLVHPTALIGADVIIGEGTSVGPYAMIDHAMIGENCVIGAGAKIGQPGFGYDQNDEGAWEHKPEQGRVVIGNHVEIGANACIDRGSYKDTFIDDGVKIDNLVHIAHNAHIGRDSVVIAGTIVCGSAHIGPNVRLAPGAIVREHKTVGANAVVGLGAVVVSDVEAGDVVAGVPARVLTHA